MQDGAFDAAAEGTVAILHISSPVNITADEPEEYVVPAEKGTLSALRAAARTPSVKRVVFLSSAGVVIEPVPGPTPRVYDETCWNDADVREVQEKGRAASQLAKYGASKVIAERRASELYEQAKAAGAEWDFTVVVPGWVFGPVLHEVSGGPEGLNASNYVWYNAVVKGELFEESLK